MRENIKRQKQNTKDEFEERTRDVVTQFAEQVSTRREKEGERRRKIGGEGEWGRQGERVFCLEQDSMQIV